MDEKFCQMLFLHLLRLSCEFWLLLMWCITLFCVRWTILVTLGLIPLGCSLCCWIWTPNILLRIFACIFIKDEKPVVFLFWWYLYLFLVSVGFIEYILECSVLFHLLGELEKNWCEFFRCLVEFSCEAIWSWTFVCRESWALFFF